MRRTKSGRAICQSIGNLTFHLNPWTTGMPTLIRPRQITYLIAAGLWLAPMPVIADQGGVESVGEANVRRATLAETCEQADNLRTLSMALAMTGLDLYLEGEGPVTILAPTDQAFAKLSEQFLTELGNPENLAALRAILAYHLVPGAVSAGDLAEIATFTTIVSFS